MTVEKKSDVYMKVISFLLAALVATILYVWDGAEARLVIVEQDSRIAETERKLLLQEDGHIIEKINEFKADVREQFKELKEEIRK